MRNLLGRGFDAAAAGRRYAGSRTPRALVGQPHLIREVALMQAVGAVAHAS
jgi:hypothetical protein